MSETLAEAFDPPNTMGSKLERFSSGIPVLLHKHMFRHDLLNETELAEIKARTDILWVLVVRSPCDWYVVNHTRLDFASIVSLTANTTTTVFS